MKTFITFLKESNLKKLKSLKKTKPNPSLVKKFEHLGKGDTISIKGKTYTLESNIEIKTHPYNIDGWYIAPVSDGTNHFYITSDYPKKSVYKLYSSLKQSGVKSEYEPISKNPKYTSKSID